MSRRISETMYDYCIKLHTQDDGRIMRSWRSCLLINIRHTFVKRLFFLALIQNRQINCSIHLLNITWIVPLHI